MFPFRLRSLSPVRSARNRKPLKRFSQIRLSAYVTRLKSCMNKNWFQDVGLEWREVKPLKRLGSFACVVLVTRLKPGENEMDYALPNGRATAPSERRRAVFQMYYELPSSNCVNEKGLFLPTNSPQYNPS